MASGSPELSPEGSRIAPDTDLVNPNEERSMSTSPAEMACGSLCGLGSAGRAGSQWERGSTWQFLGAAPQASLNWLALDSCGGVECVDNDTPGSCRRRPEALRGYSSVSVRAAHRTLSTKLTLRRIHKRDPISIDECSPTLSFQRSQKRKRTVKLRISNVVAHACHRNQ